MDFPKRKPAVLIVDDDFDVRELMSDLIRDDGFEVLCARDGREALLELRSRPVKVVLLDINMPTMDGQTFRAEQLADPKVAMIPIVLVTGDERYRTIAVELGASAVLQKPFLPDSLLDTLRKYR